MAAMRWAREAWLLIAAGVLLAAAAGATVAVRAQAETSGWVAHTYQVIAEMENALSFIAEAEAAQRSFLLTGAEAQAERSRGFTPRVNDSLEALHRLTADNPPQQGRVRALQEAAARRLELLERVAQWRREHPAEALEARLDEGQRQMSDVHAHVDAIRREEERLLERRLVEAVHASWLGVSATIGTGVLSVVLLFVLDAVRTRHAAHLEQANRRLAEQAAALDATVQAKTAELREANDALQGFAHTIAHDLRAPLRNIEGFANVLMEDEAPRLSEQGARYVHRLADSAARMNVLITDLLTYSRIGRQNMPLRTVNLDLLVDEVVTELEPQVLRSGGAVHVQKGLPPVIGHAETLAQALANLLGNALKFAAPGSAPRVHVQGRRVGNRVQLDVVDEGIGIAPADQERIFSVFERLHGDECYPGSGVGLSIVRKVVERTGGTVSVRSDKGKGAAFTLDLPAAETDAFH